MHIEERNILIVGFEEPTNKYITLKLLTEKQEFQILHNEIITNTENISNNHSLEEINYFENYKNYLNYLKTINNSNSIIEDKPSEIFVLLNLYIVSKSKREIINDLKNLLHHEFIYTNTFGRDNLIKFLNGETNVIALDSNYFIKIIWTENNTIMINSNEIILNLKFLKSLNIKFQEAIVDIPMKSIEDLKILEGICEMIISGMIIHIVYLSELSVSRPYSFYTMLINTVNNNLILERLIAEDKLRCACQEKNASYIFLRPINLRDLRMEEKNLILKNDIYSEIAYEVDNKNFKDEYSKENAFLHTDSESKFCNSYENIINWIARRFSWVLDIHEYLSCHDLAKLIIPCLFICEENGNSQKKTTPTDYIGKTILVFTDSDIHSENIVFNSNDSKENIIHAIRSIKNDSYSNEKFKYQYIKSHQRGKQLFTLILELCAIGIVAATLEIWKRWNI